MNAGPHLLDTLVHGRLDGAAVTPETGLVALTIWCAGGVRRLGVGVGPRVVGIGWLPAAPVFAAGAKHPLVAVLKAHAVGRSVRHVTVDDDGAVWITFGDEADHVRVRLFAARAGEARVLDAHGETLTFWQGERSRPPHVCEPEGSLDEVGDELVRVSDGLTAELRRGALVRALRGLAKRLARRKEAVELDLERIDDVGRLQRIGRMLLAQGANVPRGAAKVTLEDWEEGGTLDVELDPALPAKPQAVGFFAKAKRIQRGEAVMWARLEETQRQLDAVRALEAAVDGADTVTLSLLQRWMAAAKELGVRENEAMPARGRAKPVEREPFIEYASARGQRILVGRGSVDNDRLTLRVAKPHDIWMHTRGVPGAHVVIPLARGATLHPEVLVDAATLAAHHSDARGADFVEITWTEKRYVRKPRKAPPGRVALDREKVLAAPRARSPRAPARVAQRALITTGHDRRRCANVGGAMADTLASHTLPSGHVLKVVQGDLTKEHVDAVVNAANEWLAHGGGVAGAIVRRGGLEVQWESDAWVEANGKLAVGAVAVTGAGMLPCKKVIHAVGPVWEGGDDEEEDNLRAAATNSLRVASEMGLASLAMPAISSGIFGFPKDLCATILVEAAVDWFAQNPESSVRELRFTNIDAPTVGVFLAAFRARFGA